MQGYLADSKADTGVSFDHISSPKFPGFPEKGALQVFPGRLEINGSQVRREYAGPGTHRYSHAWALTGKLQPPFPAG